MQTGFDDVADQPVELPASPCRSHRGMDRTRLERARGREPDRISRSHGVQVRPASPDPKAATEAARKAARMVFDSGRRSRLSGEARAEVLNGMANLIEPGRFTTSGSESLCCTSKTLQYTEQLNCMAASEFVLAGASTLVSRPLVSPAPCRGTGAKSSSVSDRKRSQIRTAQTAIQPTS